MIIGYIKTLVWKWERVLNQGWMCERYRITTISTICFRFFGTPAYVDIDRFLICMTKRRKYKCVTNYFFKWLFSPDKQKNSLRWKMLPTKIVYSCREMNLGAHLYVHFTKNCVLLVPICRHNKYVYIKYLT